MCKQGPNVFERCKQDKASAFSSDFEECGYILCETCEPWKSFQIFRNVMGYVWGNGSSESSNQGDKTGGNQGERYNNDLSDTQGEGGNSKQQDVTRAVKGKRPAIQRPWDMN